MSFAVLIGNAFAPLIDLLMPKKKAVVRS